MLRIYNDFLKDFCRHYPDREIGLACLPYGNIDDAVKEIHRVAKMGIKGLELSAPGTWSRCGTWSGGRCGTPSRRCNCHCTSTPSRRPRRGPARASPARFAAPRCSPASRPSKWASSTIIAALIGAGVLERHPRLKVSFGESGIGWLPYALDRMDFEYEDRFRDLMKMKPSEYWRRQVQGDLPVRPDRHQARRRHRGRDPDVGLRLPAHRRRVAGILEIHRGAIRRPRAEIVHKITCEDAAKFYGLIN
jgi:hypothetical protein